MTQHSNRPLSPHLQVYKLPLTALISITHRMTGVFLSFGLFFLTALLFLVNQGESVYETVQWFLNMWIIKIIVWGFIFSLFFHLIHGVRHLIWDSGDSFEKDQLTNYALGELVATVILTTIALI